MRIKELEIGDFKNLRGVSVEFDSDQLITVLLGRNGTGKSNLLEALVVLFRDLDLGERPAFAYRILYQCREHQIEIQANPSKRRHTQITIDDKSMSFTNFTRVPGKPYLPTHIFGYYSGFTDRFERLFERHQTRFYRDLIDPAASGDLPLRPLFYVRPVHSQFVLLAFFLDDTEAVRGFLRDYLRIIGFESATFVLKRPDWAKRGTQDQFWGARGTVREFLENLQAVALAPIRNQDRQFLFVQNISSLSRLFQNYRSLSDFFKALESTYLSELIEEVRINVRVNTAQESLTFTELSEGEQQLLTVLGLLRFTREAESLFLLDEPDTHLNPAWSLAYLGLLKEFAGGLETSQVLLATHDPVTISGLERSQVRVLSDRGGQIVADPPDEDPKGMGIAGLLTSPLFGLRSTLDLETMALLDEKRLLAVKPTLTAEEQTRLDKLNLQLGSVDFTSVVRDPLYRRFVEAMSRALSTQPPTPPTLTPEQMEKREEIAAEVVEQLLKETTQ